MKKVKFNVEETNTGYSAYHENRHGIIATTGDNLADLRANIVEAYNLQASHYKKNGINKENIGLVFDLQQFFEYYNAINVKGLATRMNMNYTLLSQYISGVKVPSEKQVHKVLEGVKQLGKELSEADFA